MYHREKSQIRRSESMQSLTFAVSSRILRFLIVVRLQEITGTCLTFEVITKCEMEVCLEI